MHVAWDAAKALANKKKHQVGFDEAMTVFFDEHALQIPDPDHSGHEDRFIMLGLSRRLRELVVCHCYRGDGEVIRIISARQAARDEREQYWRAR